MVLLGIAASAFVVGLSGAMMPGPLLSVAVAETARRGFRAGPLLVLGHALPELLLAVLFALGLSGFLENKTLVGIIGIAGGLFMALLGMRIFFQARRGADIDLEKASQTRLGPVMAGFVASVSNPGWIIWWATIGANYIMISLGHGIIGLVFFLVGHQMSDLAWYSMIALLVSRGRHRVSKRVYHGVIYSCAALVVVMAVFFTVNGVVALVSA